MILPFPATDEKSPVCSSVHAGCLRRAPAASAHPAASFVETLKAVFGRTPEHAEIA
jgi:hypothetical protein